MKFKIGQKVAIESDKYVEGLTGIVIEKWWDSKDAVHDRYLVGFVGKGFECLGRGVFLECEIKAI